MKYKKVLFIDKIKGAARSRVRSIASPHAFDRMLCVRPQAHVCLIVCCAFDRKVCDRSQITALKSHEASVEAMAARAMWDMRLTRHALHRAPCAQAQCDQAHQVCSIALAVA
jgi:hypothetical protein